jgi:DNA helicase HerA-like ATPase
MTVGIVSGPGETANEFVFVTPDSTEIKTGEFIYYRSEVTVETEEGVVEEYRDIYARVTGREQERGYPDQFMANPDVAPDAVASKLGIASEGVDLYRVTASIIGYFDGQMGDFANPRVAPDPGKEVRMADADELESVLTDVDPESEGSAHIGELLHRDPGEVDVHLPVDSFAATHLSILASTGSGKSYTASVLIEEMMKPDSRAAVLVLDPHGEYGTLQQMQGIDEFESGGYSPDVEIKGPDDLKIRISELSFTDLVSVLSDPSDAQEAALRGAWNRLDDETHLSAQNIIDEIGDDVNDSVADALEWRLRSALGRSVFDENKNVPLTDILAPGQCSVLQMDRMDLVDQRMIATVLLRRINEERMLHEKGEEDSDLDFPVFILLEEGHRFAPADGEARSRGILSTILSEGRKFGIGVGIISQRPSKIDDDVLSQCKSQVIMEIQNPNDQDAVKRGVEDVGEDLLSELPGLTPGQAVIAGDTVNTPFMADIRERVTDHDAESLEATEKWSKAWQRKNSEPEGRRDPYNEEGVEDRDSPL